VTFRNFESCRNCDQMFSSHIGMHPDRDHSPPSICGDAAHILTWQRETDQAQGVPAFGTGDAIWVRAAWGGCIAYSRPGSRR